MHRRGWPVEIMSWAHSCNQRMRRWAEENGVFVALDDFYEAITFLEPSQPGFELASGRESAESVTAAFRLIPPPVRRSCRETG